MHPWIQTQLPRLEVELKLRLGSCQGGKSDSKEKAAFHREIRRNPLQTQQSILETPVEHQIMNLSGTPNCSNSRFVVFVDGKFLTPPKLSLHLPGTLFKVISANHTSAFSCSLRQDIQLGGGRDR